MHPQFQLHALGASSSSAGKRYAVAVEGRWKQSKPIPQSVRDMVVQECKTDAVGFSECEVVFSGLDSGPAGPVGELLAQSKLIRAMEAGNDLEQRCCACSHSPADAVALPSSHIRGGFPRREPACVL